MATEQRRPRRRRLVLALAAAVPAMLVLSFPRPVLADSAWWQPVAFIGQSVGAVSVVNGTLTVATAAGTVTSTDGGRTFTPTQTMVAAPVPVSSAGVIWDIRGGTVFTGPDPGPQHLPVEQRDPGAPNLGANAHMLAAPAAAPGVVVTAGDDNHVWRRTQSGAWATAFILLPAGGLSGTPRVTALAAFTRSLSAAVYMGTDGYGVLLSQDGGDDWIRADPGLPGNVLGLATDASSQSLYAATDQGLYVHHLQAIPRPPTYADSQLWLRWLGIALVALLATVAALLALRRLTPEPGAERG
jgi:hypothetical protein